MMCEILYVTRTVWGVEQIEGRRVELPDSASNAWFRLLHPDFPYKLHKPVLITYNIRMKTEYVKTSATTEEVSSHGVEKRVKRRKSHRNTPCAGKNRGRTGKKICKPMEQEENHEKDPHWSWARSQMGNINLP